MKIQVKVEGVSPLLMHRFPIETEEVKTSTRTKKVYVPAEEAEKSAYRDEEGKLCLLSTHFKSSMVKSAGDYMYKGKKSYKDYIKSGILFDEIYIRLDQQEYILDSVPVVIGRARIVRTRPKLNKWSCQFTFEIIDESLSETVVKEILEAAGKYRGVGDNRPEYGRFKVVEFTEIKS